MGELWGGKVFHRLSVYPAPLNAILGREANQLTPKRARMAIAVTGQNRQYEWTRILRRHWISTAHTCGIAQDVAQAMIDELVANTPAVIAKVNAALSPTFPAQVADTVLAVIRAAAAKLVEVHGTGP